MVRHINDSLSRSFPTLVQDFLGATALVAMLIVGLHLPGLI